MSDTKQITPALIKTLREQTGAGMMDCKQALTQTGGDLDAAVEELRKKGVASAAKKSARIASEGVIAAAADANAAVLVEINCETDFVAKDDSFKAYAQQVANAALVNTTHDLDALAAADLEGGVSVEAGRQQLVTRIGENVSLRRLVRLPSDGASLGVYLHGTRIGVLVQVKDGSPELGRDLAMHVAATNPLCVGEADMPPEVLERERKIFQAQAEDSGKPPEIAEKMVQGRMKKFLKENTLLGQPFVKDPDQTVGHLVGTAGAKVLQMIRLEVGEGLEKRQEDFMAEVMAQVRKK